MRVEVEESHVLPAAPAFAGREQEIAALKDFWLKGHGVLSLIGIGGAGKTACAEQFLGWLKEEGVWDRVFVWSFYEDPDANHFLRSAFKKLSGGQEVKASGAGWFSLLNQLLAKGEPCLIVMDGLERVQREETNATGIYGELEDSLLKGLLIRVCSGSANAKVLITSRFPIASLEGWQGKGYSVIDIDRLGGAAAHTLARSHGLRCPNSDLDQLIQMAGGHALTIDLLASATARYYDGDVRRLPNLVVEAGRGDYRAQRLKNVLELFEQNLPSRTGDVLKCLCVFRFGVTREALLSIFVGQGKGAVSGEVAEATAEQISQDLEELVAAHLVFRETLGRYTIHPSVRDHFYRLFRDPSIVHGAVESHLAGLTSRPGIGPPTDKTSLDLLEELVYHSIKAGHLTEAEELYFVRLGGSDHLNTHLGEYTRTFRILQAFDKCPDRTGMYHCHRAFGEFEKALEWRASNRYILLLHGRLQELAEDKSPSTSALARALMGEEVRLPDRTPDVPLPSSLVALLQGDLVEAERMAMLECTRTVHWDDKARSQLVLGEVARRHGQLRKAGEHLAQASEWILPSGSYEHLCLLNLVKSRLECTEGDVEAAQLSLAEALRLASESGFLLVEALLLADKSRLMRRLGLDKEADGAMATARELASRSDVCLAGKYLD